MRRTRDIIAKQLRSAKRPRSLAVVLILGAMPVLGACSNEAGAADSAVDATAGTVAKGAEVITPATGDTLEVWKDPNCGCCKSWIDHMTKHGFTVISHDTPDMTPVKQQHGVGADLASCHTATIRGYTVEGHVPADLVRRMITEKPKIAGLAVPGMPMGSPGMEMGGMKDAYDIIAFTKDGARSVYASR